MEKTLQLSALHTLLRSTEDLIFIKDVNLVYTAVSTPFVALTKMSSAKEIVGKTDFDIFEDQSLALRYVLNDKEILKSGKDRCNYTEPLPIQNGVEGFCSTSKHILRDSDGQPIGIYGISRDITHEVKLRRENSLLQQDDLHLKLALENISVSVWEYDMHTRTLERPKAGERSHTRLTLIPDMPEGAINLFDFHPQSAEALREIFRDIHSDAPQGDAVLMLKSHPGSPYSYFRIHFTALVDSDGHNRKALVISEDITEQHRARDSYEKELAYRLELKPGVYASGLFDLTENSVDRYSHSGLIPGLSQSVVDMPVDVFLDELSFRLRADSGEEATPDFFQPKKITELYEKGHHSHSFEFLCRMIDGNAKWVKARCNFAIDPSSGHLMFTFALIDIDESKSSQRKLILAAQIDAMTGILNHDASIKKIGDFLSKAPPGLHALMWIDVDHFKSINDTFGHLCGDAVIKDIASIIKNTFRGTDIVGRIGGDEFVVLMKNGAHIDIIRRKAQELTRALEYVCTVGRVSINLSASIGVALYEEGMSLKHLLSQADDALYRAKSLGKNRFVFASSDPD